MLSPTLTLESPCDPPSTQIEKRWPFVQYYVGERDKEQRKNGDGTNHWSGAESLEWYTGRLLRDTMHGIGEYRCRHREEPNVDVTYEGYFYNNDMHGYGVTSYPDGNVFTGIFHSNIRWGPGVKTEARLREDVGLWKGTQLVRLTWRPTTPSVIPDLMATSVGCDIVAKQRSLLIVKRKTIGETNPALELLKQYGADPLTAAQKWTKLYPKNCTDGKSQLFYTDNFDRAYYDGNEIVSLEDYKPEPSFKLEIKEENQKSTAILNDRPSPEIFYAWNNNKMIIHMMKHCYQHEKQRKLTQLNLEKVLNGPRQLFKPAGDHELDCRALLMSSYLGDIFQVTHLINEDGINPNVTDMQGNSAVMYAACGNQPVILNFLVEAGAQINDHNDSCCTPLGVVLINYACTQLGIQPCDILKAILPLTIDTVLDQEMIEKPSEWKIQRNWMETVPMSKKDTPDPLKKSGADSNSKKNDRNDTQSLNQTKSLITNEQENPVYKNLFYLFKIKVDDMFSVSNATAPVKYIFEVNDMVGTINALTVEVEPKKDTKDKKEPKKTVSKIPTLKKSVEVATSAQLRPEDLIKEEQLKTMMSTITQLLLDGADPRLVRCPQPALFLAVVAQNVDLIEMLVKHGADVNEVYHGSLGYTPLDIAVSGPLTYQNLDVIRTLLKVGARPDHRIPVNDPNIIEEGPTLLHAVLAKEQNIEEDEEIWLQLLELLLVHGCDPLAQYMGQSSIYLALSKSADAFDVFIENPNTDLNGIINKFNQTILVKMFQLAYCRTISIAERVQKLTHILLFGADPLLKCKNEQNEYDNLFVYAKNVLSELEKTTTKSPSASAPAVAKKSNTDIKGKKSKNAMAKPTGSKTANGKGIIADEIGDYKQGLSQATNCARLLFIRWIQAELLKELIKLVDRFKCRHWNMILKEYKNGKRLGLWLNPVRCLEIWDILQTTNKRIYKDKTIKKHVLCIVVYHFKKMKKILRWAVSAEDKASIESEVAYFIREHNLVSKVQDYKRPYVTPELTPSNEIEKFNICFECALPLVEGNIRCYKCKLVSFCSFECMKINIERYNCHPCSAFLKSKYFPVMNSSEIEVEVTNI